MKLFKLAAWASGIIAVIIMILAGISLIFGISLFGFRHAVHYFPVANNFFLLAILCLLAYQGCQCCKDK
jgi:type IV secretory pathway VirB2 component (pilin)